LAEILGAYAPTPEKGGALELVFINGCSSYEFGRAVHAAGIPHVICWRTKVHDAAARIFSIAFYKHLQNAGTTYEDAFKQAQYAVKTEPMSPPGNRDVTVQRFELVDPDAGATTTGAAAAGIPYHFAKPKCACCLNAKTRKKRSSSGGATEPKKKVPKIETATERPVAALVAAIRDPNDCATATKAIMEMREGSSHMK
jgi:hypothetical protein